jgi:hypothetical protein
VASRRSRSAAFTVSTERSIAPEWQKSATIDWATMFGEMYVFVAVLRILAIRSAGPTR